MNTALGGRDYARLIVKVGSSLLIGEQGTLDRVWLEGLVADIAALYAAGKDILVVSSGAIAIGAGELGLNRRRARIGELQAAAAAGQGLLAHAWREALAAHGITSAQVLLTLEDTENRRRFLNARGTLGKLLELRAVPVINENDTVATEEIRYGDNDRLAARVAQLVMADLLVLLSDVDGFYTDDPGRNPDAGHIAEVQRITGDMAAMAGETRSDFGSGGMATKVAAARIATRAGCATIIASGARSRPLSALADGARHTLFHAPKSPAAVRKQWLAGTLEVAGQLTIDAGAARALADGGSLLPVGIVSVDGAFHRGDVVSIVDGRGVEVGRGLAEYGSEEAAKLAGSRSSAIEDMLGYRGPAVMVHRDELVLFDENG